MSGTPAPSPEAIAIGKSIAPKITPIGTPAPATDAIAEKTDPVAAPVGEVEVKVKAKDPADPPARPKTPSVAPGDIVPPVIRIPQGGLLGSSSEGKRATDTTLLCEILLRNGSVTQENVDKALALQEDKGGQIGRILVSIGACEEQAIARALVEQLRLRKKTGYITDI